MAKIAVIKTGEQYFANCIASNKHIKLDKFIFANVPYVTGSTEVNVNGTLPTVSQIKHTASVTQSGLISDNAVVYSVVLDSTIGDFEFNYIGLMNSETNTLCMVLHTDIQQKLQSQGQQQGNTLTESLWLEIDGAAQATGITVNVETWMIDYSARMAGEDERIRLSNLDHYGRLAVHSGFNITFNTDYTISPGVAYVAGLRVEHLTAKSMTANNGESIYIDAWLSGTVTGAWSVNYKIVVGVDLCDYKEGIFQHYVERIATIGEPGIIQKPDIYSVVNSVNGESGTVTVTPAKINAVNKNGDKMSSQLIFDGKDGNGVLFKLNGHEYKIIIGGLNGGNNLIIGCTGTDGNKTRLRWIADENRWNFESVNSVTINNIPTLIKGDGGFLKTRIPVKAITDFDDIDKLNSGEIAFVKASDTAILPSSSWCYLHQRGVRDGGAKGGAYTLQPYNNDAVYFGRVIENSKTIKWTQAITTDNLDSHVVSYPIGAPIDWFSDVMPDDGRTYLYLDGSVFDKTKYPKLAKVFPSGKLPDVRGVVRRGMDNGRGLDPNRVLGSYQDDAIRNITGRFVSTKVGNTANGAFSQIGMGPTKNGSDGDGQFIEFDASKVVPTAPENRMKNISCHVITRAN